MANKLSVVEFEDPHSFGSFPMQVTSFAEGNVVEQTSVDYTTPATSVQSTAFASTTKFLRVSAGLSPCWLKFGLNPTAVDGTGLRLAAGQAEYYFVKPGDKVAVIPTAN